MALANLKISEAIDKKLAHKHGVSRSEVEQCFMNRTGKLLVDSREDHKTDPPTLWFLSRTNRGRCLKVVYIQNGPNITLKSAFEPNDDEMRIYARLG